MIEHYCSMVVWMVLTNEAVIDKGASFEIFVCKKG